MPITRQNYMMPFPTRLRALLEETGVSQQEIADYVGVKRQTVAQWKDGKTVPDINNFKKIAEFFKLPYEYLYGETDSRVRENINISKSLGLSDKAIENLKHWISEEEFYPEIHYSDVVSEILEHDAFSEAVRCIVKSSKEYVLCKCADKNSFPTYTLPSDSRRRFEDDGMNGFYYDDLENEPREYEIEATERELGKKVVNSKELSDFYRYQSNNLFNEVIGLIQENVYINHCLTDSNKANEE